VIGTAALLMLTACDDGSSIPDTLPPIETVTPTRFVVISDPTTTLVPIAAELVQDCLDWVQFGVYTGNGLAISMWENAVQDLENLALDCEYLGRRDLGSLQELSRQWNEIETFLNGATTSEAPTTGTNP
jgi:hypothetical protein